MLAKPLQISTTINKDFKVKISLSDNMLRIQIKNNKSSKKYLGEFSNQTLENNIKAFFDDIQTLFEFIQTNLQKRQAVNIDQSTSLTVTIVTNIGAMSKQKKFTLQTREILNQIANKQINQESKLLKKQIESLKAQIDFCANKIDKQNKRISFLQGKNQIQFNINLQQGQKLDQFEKQLNLIRKMLAQKTIVKPKQQIYQDFYQQKYGINNPVKISTISKLDQSRNTQKVIKQIKVQKPQNNAENQWEIRDPKLKKLASLGKYESGFNLVVKILRLNQSVKKYNRKSYNCLVGDSSGVGVAIIPESALCKLNKTVYLKNCVSLVFGNHIEIRIPDGQVEQSPIEVKQFRLENNISQKIHKALDGKDLAKKGIHVHGQTN